MQEPISPSSPSPLPLPFPMYVSALVGRRSVGPLVPSPSPLPSPASLHRSPLPPDDTTNNRDFSSVAAQDIAVCAHARTHADYTLCCGCLTAIFVGGKKKETPRARKGKRLFPSRERGTKDGASRESRRASPLHNFVSHRACTKQYLE